MTRLHILHIADLREPNRCWQRVQAFRRLGHEVTELSYYPSHTRADDPCVRGVAGLAVRAAWKLGFGWCPEDIDRRTRDPELARPDVVFVEKANPIAPWTLSRLRTRWPDAKLVAFSEDDMFARHNRTHQYRLGLPQFDLVVTTKSYNADPNELPALGAKRVLFVDKSYDPLLHRPLAITDADRARIGGQVVFVGTFEGPRAQSMLRLAHEGIDVRIWGNGWHDWIGRHPRLRVEGKALYGDDYVRAIGASDINLAFLRKSNRDLQTDRTMEIPACGGFMLAERTGEHLRLFRDGEEAAFFSDNDELVETIRRALSEPEWRAAVAAGGRRRALSSGYSHDAVLERILNFALESEGAA